MRKIPLHILFLVLATLLLPRIIVYSAESRADCYFCGMWIDQNLHTRHVVTAYDGSQIVFCSLACTVKFLKTHQNDVKRIQVADYLSTELVDANEAVYLVDSDAPPIMSYTSFIAFRDNKVSEKFQNVHGGTIMSFVEAQKLL